MTIHPGTAEPGVRRHGVAAAFVAAVLLAVAGYAALAATATGTLLNVRSGALLGAPQTGAAGRLDRISRSTMLTAIAAMPLDQRLANVAMVWNVRRQGNQPTAAWLRVISRLGWRDTVALQNMLHGAALAGDLPGILDISDALLRRRQLMDEIIPVLSTIEGDPTLRDSFVVRLAGRPSWRGSYLTTTSQLQTRDQLIARFATIRALQRSRDRPDPAEVVPTIIALDLAGLPEHGFTLWQSVQPGVTRPLDDMRFVAASRSYASGHDPVPYQWQMATGQGFSADASRDGSRVVLTIDWDGRGVPMFVQQRTSATPGSYMLDVRVASEDVADLSAISFRLVCGDRVIIFRQAGVDPMHYVTADVVPCSFPVLQMTGEVQPSATAHQLAFEQIVMRPLSSTGR